MLSRALCGTVAVSLFAGLNATGATEAAQARTATLDGRGLQTAVIEPSEVGLGGTPARLALQRIRRAGATAIRTGLPWYGTAPSHVRPFGFNAENPNDPAYDWRHFDAKLRLFAQYRLEPIVAVNDSPVWARLGPFGTSPPRPADLEQFMRAAARRYSGRTPGVPRVRYWMVWIEPNLYPFFTPQFDDAGRPYSPRIYREMVNAFARGVKGVHRSNIVIAGATAPFRDISPHTLRFNRRWGPLTFMRELLCLSRSLRPTRRCSVQFDIWAHHPYTSGGPTHRAVLPDDVSLGDLPEMRKTLVAAIRAGHVISRFRVRFWATEFGWDSKPPDRCGVPIKLLTRWVAEGLYRLWQNDVSLIAWLQLRDEPPARSFVQSGLWYRGRTISADRPKAILRAFRFPFIAFPARDGVYVWGRTPNSRAGRVLVEQSSTGGWKRLGVVSANRHGIFQGRLTTTPVRTSFVRARVVRPAAPAVPFSLTAPRDRFFNPFGQSTLLENPRAKPKCVSG